MLADADVCYAGKRLLSNSLAAYCIRRVLRIPKCRISRRAGSLSIPITVDEDWLHQ